jgi:hypothetical protein
MAKAWWISGPRWTFLIISRNGIVVEAADISIWALGQRIEQALEWWERKGADRVLCLEAERRR